MKKLVLMSMLAVGSFAMAQEHGRGGKQMMKDLTPEQMATLQTKRLTLALDLSTAQQEEVQTLHLEAAKYKKAAMAERAAKKEKGNKPTAEERYAMQNDRLDRMIAMKSQMKDILNASQYEKWEKISAKKARHAKGKRGKKGQGCKRDSK
ncbi:MAG: hypothetical protein AB3N16_01690 [Flavobacteriaceae bacterium]